MCNDSDQTPGTRDAFSSGQRAQTNAATEATHRVRPTLHQRSKLLNSVCLSAVQMVACLTGLIDASADTDRRVGDDH